MVLVKIVAHKGRHKLQDRWEPEEYVVIEQPIAGTPVYKVKPVNGDNVRTLHRNLLLPLGVKLEPDYESDDSILEEDSDEDEGGLWIILLLDLLINYLMMRKRKIVVNPRNM